MYSFHLVTCLVVRHYRLSLVTCHLSLVLGPWSLVLCHRSVGWPLHRLLRFRKIPIVINQPQTQRKAAFSRRQRRLVKLPVLFTHHPAVHVRGRHVWSSSSNNPLNFELPSPARAKFGSSPFTPASADFGLFGQIDTPIIWPKTELPNFGRIFVAESRQSSLSLRFPVRAVFPTTTARAGPPPPSARWSAAPVVPDEPPDSTAWPRSPTHRFHDRGSYPLERKHPSSSKPVFRNLLAHATPLSLQAISRLGICLNRVKQKSEIFSPTSFGTVNCAERAGSLVIRPAGPPQIAETMDVTFFQLPKWGCFRGAHAVNDKQGCPPRMFLACWSGLDYLPPLASRPASTRSCGRPSVWP
jgi:hypothetical protein